MSVKIFVSVTLVALFMAGAGSTSAVTLPDLSKFEYHEMCIDKQADTPRVIVDRYKFSAGFDVYVNVFFMKFRLSDNTIQFAQETSVSAMGEHRRWYIFENGKWSEISSEEKYQKRFFEKMPADHFGTRENFERSFVCTLAESA